MKSPFHFLVVVLAAALAAARLAAQVSVPLEIVAYPDMIFHSGKVLTADDSFTVAQAVAIRDGKFLAVGDSSRIRAMAGPKTQVIDLQGKTVTPGFIDTHFHLHNYAFNRYVNGGIDIFPAILNEDVEGGESHDNLLRVLRKKAQENPRSEDWLVFTDARGEDHGLMERTMFPMLTQKDLDEALAGGPSAVGSSHGNNYSSYVLNREGMKRLLALLSPDTPGLVKDPQTGEMTGQVVGDAAQFLGRALLPWPDLKLVKQALDKSIPMYTALGITMIMTKTPGYVTAVLREYWRRGEMPIRWRTQIEVGPDTEVGFKYLGNLTDLGDSWLRITSGPGGVPRPFWDATYEEPRRVEGGRSQPHKTYEQREAEMRSEPRPSDAFLAAKYGWSMTNVHNSGNMSTDAYMAEIERGLQERVLEAYAQRFVTDHNNMMLTQTPKGNQLERMKQLGIIPSMKVNSILGPKMVADDPNKPSEATIVEMAVSQWGKERVMKMLPVKSLIKAGFKPTREADRWYYPTNYPLWNMEKLITRKDDKLGLVWGAEERVSRQEALWMSTNWAARYFGEEKEIGTIEPGKWADLVVLEKDYMTVPEDDLGEVQVLMTVIGGKVIYDANRQRFPMPKVNDPEIKLPAWAQ